MYYCGLLQKFLENKSMWKISAFSSLAALISKTDEYQISSLVSVFRERSWVATWRISTPTHCVRLLRSLIRLIDFKSLPLWVFLTSFQHLQFFFFFSFISFYARSKGCPTLFSLIFYKIWPNFIKKFQQFENYNFLFLLQLTAFIPTRDRTRLSWLQELTCRHKIHDILSYCFGQLLKTDLANVLNYIFFNSGRI